MKLFGYKPDYFFNNQSSTNQVIKPMIKDISRKVKWRCDFKDLKKDFGYELFRRSIINKQSSLSKDTIRESFLFESVFKAIVKK